MTSRIESLKEELSTLVNKGELLYYAMGSDLENLSDGVKKQLKQAKIKLPSFERDYETWYSESLAVIQQVIPDRVEDFVRLYKNERRKEIDCFTYSISDYMLGIVTRYGGQVVADGNAALPKMKSQNSILRSAMKRFEGRLFDVQEVLMADLFDSELDSARALNKNGFHRAAGAVAGVVLEKHLGHICGQHRLKTRKKHPSISDYNDMLKTAGTIKTAQWRYIQHLGDLRNLCDHKKEQDPSKEDVVDLVNGVEKVSKTIY